MKLRLLFVAPQQKAGGVFALLVEIFISIKLKEDFYMNQTEDGLVGLPFLSEVLDTTAFKRGQANIIAAPCHSGKNAATVKGGGCNG